MRHILSITAACFSLALVACGDAKTHPTALRKTLGPGGTRGGQLSMRGGCANLAEVTKRLKLSRDGFVLHTYDYDLSNAAKGANDGGEELAQMIRYRALRGPGAPTSQSAASLDELLLAPPLDALLNLNEQIGCTSVTFTAGQTFRVSGGDPRTLILTSEETNEVRTYTMLERELLIRQDLPKRVNACAGDRQFERTESVTRRLAWGDSAGHVKLSANYAGLIGAPVPADPPAPTRPRPRPAAKVAPKTASMPLFLFEKLAREAAVKARDLTCQP